jgi:hypothetical protein
VQGQASSSQLAGVEATSGQFGTLVTRTEGLHSAAVRKPEHLQEISTSCISARAGGSSTEHEQSSRSHAVLRMEVVSKAVVDAREAVDEANAQLPALKGAVDNLTGAGMYTTLYAGAGGQVLRSDDRIVGNVMADFDPEAGDLWIGQQSGVGDAIGGSGGMDSSTERKYCLRDVEGGGEARTAAEWALQLGLASPMGVQHVQVRREMDGGNAAWESKKAELAKQAAELSARLEAVKARAETAALSLAAILDAGPAALGGSLVVVDLAGADYDKRGAKEGQKESAAINKSLLALKECFRSLAANSRQAGRRGTCSASLPRPPFRDSKLTRMLEDVLCPNNASSRRNKESVSVMLVNISPVASLEKPTLNSLRYGQVMSSSGGGGGKKVASRKKTAATVACDPAILEALRAVYREHVPEKSAQEVGDVMHGSHPASAANHAEFQLTRLMSMWHALLHRWR